MTKILFTKHLAGFYGTVNELRNQLRLTLLALSFFGIGKMLTSVLIVRIDRQRYKHAFHIIGLATALVGFALLFAWNQVNTFLMYFSCIVTFVWGVQDAVVAMHVHFILFNNFEGCLLEMQVI